MKFGRYESVAHGAVLCIAIYSLVFLCGLVAIAFSPNTHISFEFTGFLLLFLLIFSIFVFFVSIYLSAGLDRGHVRDGIVFTGDGVELHTKQETVSIKWTEIREIRQIKPRGPRASDFWHLEITGRDESFITFASSNRIEKWIFTQHPELRYRFKTGCTRQIKAPL